jgi:Zn-dependent protease with chaperone function
VDPQAENSLAGAPALCLEWLPYHFAQVAFLKRTDPQLWNWFARTTTDSKAADEVRFDLLKSTYRIDRDTQAALYETLETAAAQLGLSAPVTIYQAQNPLGLNASLAYVPGEIHLILHGPITAQLTPLEIRGLFAHELSHYVLWERGGGELFTASEMLRALANDPHAHPAQFASLRLLCLYNEIYCDRGAYAATGDVKSVVSMLVKVSTGVQEVSAEGYLRQAEEIFARGAAATEELTHPEAYVRARAIKLWAEGQPDADADIERMIEGTPGLDELDLLAQERVAASTRHVLDALLWRRWFQTDPVLAHARLFFEDYAPPAESPSSAELAQLVRVEPSSLRDYYCFVLLDFASADRDLDEAPLAAALSVAESLGIQSRLMELARQELRLRKSQLEKVDAGKNAILAAADRDLAT